MHHTNDEPVSIRLDAGRLDPVGFDATVNFDRTVRGMDVMKRVKEDFSEVAKVELEPKLEGRQMIMVMAPR